MMKMDQARSEIDKIDQGLVGLLNRRIKLAIEIGKEKKLSNDEVYDPSRENGIISGLKAKNSGPLPNEDLETIYREIFSISRKMQKPVKVAYLGPQGTFSHSAAARHFGKGAQYLGFDSIKDVFWAVEKGEADIGVVPVENSVGGSVAYTYDMFVSSPLNIIEELAEEVRHNLVSKCRLNDIEKVYSHPQALTQCREWLSKNLPHAELIEVSSTARSAEAAQLYVKSAGIASVYAAAHYGLNIVAANIQDKANNITRFLVIGKGKPGKCAKSKTSIVFTTKNESGALFMALEPLKNFGINMTKIESRPTAVKNWEYVFFVDFSGFVEDAKVSQALLEMKKNTGFLRILGSYPENSLEES
ncbi:MAG TPA: prephenate dehydratase [Candidatus Diapherotrites archaeon]|uniref:Bifunctional chorismate mutase/prephenate dehydratase n=1 Tax=Candidatus Iainarchaeum sp. TaxID=3101447 RepID=A0A7J4J0C4_9ARCH|nr:prephenate dehydratase [Candidatus Diapherotrites archaeon]